MYPCGVPSGKNISHRGWRTKKYTDETKHDKSLLPQEYIYAEFRPAKISATEGGEPKNTRMKPSQSRYCECMYFTTAALARKVEKLAVDCWKPTGLSPSHAYLLLLAIDRPGIQPTEICAQLQLTPSTITRLIEKLEEKELVTRTSEGKNTSVFPTAKAIQLLPEMRHCQQEFNERQAVAMSNASECCEFLERMNKLREEIK